MSISIPKPIHDYQREVFFLLLLFIGMLILQFVDEKDLSIFPYKRDDILSGQLWRLVSGHFVHVTWMHLVLNMAGLIVIWVLFRDILTQRTWWLLGLGSIIVIDVALLIFHPEIKWYMGFSGVLHGYFAGGATLQIRLYGTRGLLYLILLIIKLLWEQLSGPLPGSTELSGARVITESHLYGAIGGSIVMLWLIVTSKNQPEKSTFS